MGYNVVADAAIDFAGQDTLIGEVLFAAVGPEADDALGPGGGHPGDLEQLLDACVIQIHLVFGIDGGVLLRSGGKPSVLVLTQKGQGRSCEYQGERAGIAMHRTILLPEVTLWQSEAAQINEVADFREI